MVSWFFFCYLFVNIVSGKGDEDEHGVLELRSISVNS
jgi:hypothetical protein